MDIGLRILTWRKAAGLSQKQLAKAIGVTQPAVFQWERGSTEPLMRHVEMVAEACGVTMEQFYGLPLLVEGAS